MPPAFTLVGGTLLVRCHLNIVSLCGGGVFFPCNGLFSVQSKQESFVFYEVTPSQASRYFQLFSFLIEGRVEAVADFEINISVL